MNQLKTENDFMKKEVQKYKDIALKSRNISNTIEVKNNLFGLTEKDIEDLSYRSVVLELEV